MNKIGFLQMGCWLCLGLLSCSTPTNSSTNNNKTMIQSEKQLLAHWQAPNNAKPLSFVYQTGMTGLVSHKAGYWQLTEAGQCMTQTLANIQEVVDLQTWEDAYAVVAFDAAEYTNRAYKMTLEGQPELLASIADPSHLYYNPQSKLCYYRNTALELHSYQPESQTTAHLLAGQKIVDLAQSDNGAYLAVQNEDHAIEVLEVPTLNVVHQYPTLTDGHQELIGITNDGQVLVTQHQAAEKNSEGTDATPVVVMLAATGEKTLVPTSSGWAAWSKGHLLVLHEGRFELYDAQAF